MNQPLRQRRRNYWSLVALVLLASAYRLWFDYQGTLTGSNTYDGIFGALLGLYICSHPAANLLDLLLLGRSDQSAAPSRWSTLVWVALNGFVLVIGWTVIVLGTTRFYTQAP